MKETTEYIALLQAWATTERQRRGPGAGLRVFVIDGAFATFIGCHRAPVLTCAMRPPSVLAQVLKQTGPGHEEEPTARNTQGNAIPAEPSVDRTLAGEPAPAFSLLSRCGVLDAELPLSAYFPQPLCRAAERENS